MTRDDVTQADPTEAEATRDERSAEAILEALRERDLVEMLDRICQSRGVTREEVCGRGRTKNVARARHELWWQLRKHPGMSYGEIARLFDRNHSTVMTGVRAVERARLAPSIAA